MQSVGGACVPAAATAAVPFNNGPGWCDPRRQRRDADSVWVVGKRGLFHLYANTAQIARYPPAAPGYIGRNSHKYRIIAVLSSCTRD